MNYYDEIKQRLIKNEIYDKTKDYAKDRNKVITYFEIGKLLNDAGKKYGNNIIDEYSSKLVIEVGKKYNRRTLFRMKQFYSIFSNEKVSPLVTHLNWSHCIALLPLKDIDKINYYISQIVSKNLTKRELEKIIKLSEYERLPAKTKNKLIKKQELEISDLVPNPIVIKTNDKKEELTEYALKETILNNLDEFLLQLGDGYAYISNEYKIKVGNSYNYIDLLLFNYLYNSFIVIELKVTELRKEHIGQIEVYMNYIDKNIKAINQDKTIGIIICKKDNKYVIEYSSDDRILSREYKLINI